MIRPVTLLCLADLHYENYEIPEIIQLGHFINNEICKRSEVWRPEYLAVAGDIINWTEEKKNIKNKAKYAKAAEEIGKLIKILQIQGNHVVFVPGNHDNTISVDIEFKRLSNNLEAFNEFSDSDAADAKKMAIAFEPYFEDYINFVQNFSQRFYFKSKCRALVNIVLDLFGTKKSIGASVFTKAPNVHRPEYTDSFKKTKLKGGDELAYLSGVRVFEDDKLCFVLTNTEWLYVPEDPFTNKNRMDNATKEGIRRYMDLYEKCRLCAPFVKDAFKLIHDKYTDYTVVTLSHRGLDDMRGERYVTDKEKIDSIQLIKANSHILLSGHDHTTYLEPPTLINNKVQHFKLGCVGRGDPATYNHIRTATLVRINPAQNRTDFIQMEYDNNRGRGQWTVKNEDSAYPLVSNYKSLHDENKNDFGIVVIRAKSNAENDVNRAIQNYYRSEGWEKTQICIVKEKIDDSFSVPEGEKNVLIVIWHDYEVFLAKGDREEIKREWKEGIDSFTAAHKGEILTQKITLSEVYVDRPVYDRLENK